MPQPAALGAFANVTRALDLALEREEGVFIAAATPAEAKSLRQRCYTARDRDRRQNARIYADSPSHPLCGGSIWDPLNFLLSEVEGKPGVLIKSGGSELELLDPMTGEKL